MNRRTNARIAGFTFLIYIAAGVTSMVLFRKATGGTGIAAQLHTAAQHATTLHMTLLLGLVQNLSALVLAVTLYALTREQDPDIAMLGMTCRVAEGVAGMNFSQTLGLLWLTRAAGTPPADVVTRDALGGLFLSSGGFEVSATFFAIGSTLFSGLLLRGRMIPVWLAWLGVFASVLLVVCVPLQFATVLRGPATSIMWLPMLVFELVFAAWLIVRGVALPSPSRPGEATGRENAVRWS